MANEPLRYAHPLFPQSAQNDPDAVAAVAQHVTDNLLPIPTPQRDPTMALADIVGSQGAQEIQQEGAICLHIVGDTGEPHGNWQELISEAMAADYNAANSAISPAFFLHLGDVNYYDNTDSGYNAQFYSPYKNYPGKIIAIPGNHDGETFIAWKNASSGQSTTLAEFLANFCQPAPGVPPAAGTIYREMISQPAVYWYLNTPFADFIGLYSNVGESEGCIGDSANVGMAQVTWLNQTLKQISANQQANGRKALVILVHHPPYSNGMLISQQMLTDIDNACSGSSTYVKCFRKLL